MKSPGPALLLFVIAMSGCAHTRVPVPTMDAEPKPALHIEPLRIVGGEDPLTQLDAYDGDDLFRLGFEAFEAGEYVRAATLYERMLSEFPSHEDRTPATWNLGLAFEKAGRLYDSAVAFGEYATLSDESSPLEAAHSRIRLSILLQHVGRYAESAEPLARAADYEDLEIQETWEIRILQAMVLADSGGFDRAETELNRVRREIKRTSLREGERYPYESAMVWYEAGQLYRMRSAAIVIDEVDDMERLDADLSQKAGFLLESRQHLKRALLHRTAAWSGPSAVALGGVYEDFRADLLAAPRPSDLDEEAAVVYAELLAERTRQFLEKAAVDYRDVLRLSVQLRMEEAWIDVVRSALDRCESELASGFTAEATPRVPGPGDG